MTGVGCFCRWWLFIGPQIQDGCLSRMCWKLKREMGKKKELKSSELVAYQNREDMYYLLVIFGSLVPTTKNIGELGAEASKVFLTLEGRIFSFS